MKKLFPLFLLLAIVAIDVQAQTFIQKCSTGQELRYMVLSDRKTVEVSWVSDMGANSKVIIPDKVTYKSRKYTVTAIGRRAFVICDSMISVTLPNTITTIGDGAFDGCLNLTSIILPNTITTIGDGAFDGCLNLTSIILPDSITSIGWSTFSDCRSLHSITIPHSVTSIGEWAFSGCLNLTAIILPNTLTSIGKRAFHDCLNITSLTIPSSVISIGDEAFAGCTHLSSILIPSSVTEIGHEIFANCHSLHNVVIASDNPVYRVSPTNVGDSDRILLIDKRTGHEFEGKGDIILRDPEVRAMFPSGVDSLKKFLIENVKLSPRCIEVQGVVILEFVVETDGSITSINVLSSYCGGCQEYVNDAVRLVKAMPKWDPAQDEEQPCRSYYQLPITYCLR